MLISDEYRSLNRALHQQNQMFGSMGHRWAERVAGLAKKHAITSILDYGCGKGTLLDALPALLGPAASLSGYDPAVPGLDVRPAAADLVVCSDVLEHIEPVCLDPVLDELRDLTLRFAFLVVSTRPAISTLPDGRNAHLIVEPYSWWLPKLWSRWEIRGFQQTAEESDEFIAFLRAK